MLAGNREGMNIPASNGKATCAAAPGQVLHTSERPLITRDGRVAVRLTRATSAEGPPAWMQLRGRGRLTGSPGDSVLIEGELDAVR